MQVLGLTLLSETSAPNGAVCQSTRVGRWVGGCLRESTAAELNSRVKKKPTTTPFQKRSSDVSDAGCCVRIPCVGFWLFFFLEFYDLVSLGREFVWEHADAGEGICKQDCSRGWWYSQNGLGVVLGESWLMFVELNYWERSDVEEKGVGRKEAGWERYAQDKWSSTHPISSKSLFHVGLGVWKKLVCMWGAENCRAMQKRSSKVCNWGMCWCLQLI